MKSFVVLRRKTILFILCLAAVIAGRFLDFKEIFGHPPAAPPIRSHMGNNILVFAPHNDDETLGTGGIIAETLRRGGQIHVALMTNGDGFRVAEAIVFKDLRTTPKDLVEFGYVRQRETLDAMRYVGLPASNVAFLGYPDRGLATFWTDNWSPSALYTSRYTRADHSPYRNSFRRAAPYCGASVIGDVKELITRIRPDVILLPHSMDAHADHRATHNLVLYALEELRRDNPALASRIRVETYLVHRGNWPKPSGYHPRVSLLPPRTLDDIHIPWWRYPMEPETAERKIHAITLYRTQMRVMSHFLISFARPDELFADWPLMNSAPAAPGGFSRNPDIAADWAGIAPASLDPVEDTFLRDLETGADLRAVYYAHDAKNLYVRIQTTHTVRATVVYRLLLKPIDPVRRSLQRPQLNIEIMRLRKATAEYSFTDSRRRLVRSDVAGRISFRRYKNNIEVVVPRDLLKGADRFFLDAYTLYRDRVAIDYHFTGPVLMDHPPRK